MAYNLLEELWLPLARRSGALEWVPPWRISDRGAGGEDPFLRVAAPRPDLAGALCQFLAGLLQTLAPPPDPRAWRRWAADPPPPEELRERFRPAAGAFDLDGEGPRFLQEKLPATAERWPIHLLLPDQPEPTKEETHKDHFVKRGGLAGLCRACAAAALFALQTNAPAGGRGHLTGLRGGGPLTTLPLGGDLWQTLWLAVLPEPRFLANFPRQREQNPASLFPWLFTPQPKHPEEPTSLTPEQADPAQCFWGLPRRLWLDWERTLPAGACPLCGRSGQELVTGYSTRPNGNRYAGAWEHPLSPHYLKDGAPLPVHGQPGGLAYRDFLGLVVADHQGGRLPARVVAELDQDPARAARAQAGGEGLPPRLWVFGYDMDNKKARGWVEATLPLVLLPDEQREEFAAGVRGLVQAADHAAYQVAASLKEAWFGPKSKVKANQGDLARLGRLLWEATEKDFYARLGEWQRLVEQGANWGDLANPALDQFKKDWLKTLCRAALQIFDDHAQWERVAEANPKRLALARRSLGYHLSAQEQGLCALLGLPAPVKPQKPARGKRKGEEK